MSDQEPQPRRKLAWWYVTEREVFVWLFGIAVGAAIVWLLWALAG